MSTEKKSEKGLPASPLLNAQPPQAKSTINLNKLEKSRFTEIRSSKPSKNRSETSSLRVIIYVVIVIVIGVGAALLARQLINNPASNSSNDAQANTNTELPSYTVTSKYSVILAEKLDSAATNLPANDDFKESTLLTIGTTTVNASKSSLTDINYQDYKTFSRVSFVLSTTENKLPKTNISYDSAKKSLVVEFVGLQTIEEELKISKSINSIVKEINFDSATNKYTIVFEDASGFRAFASEDTLNIDIRTKETITSLAQTTSNNNTSTNTGSTTNTSTSNTNTTTDSNKPAAPHYTNEFSQNTQYVSSKVTDKSIALNNYYTWDQGQFFEFSWAEEGKKGDSYVPNAKAYLKTESNINYIYIEIENVTRATLPNGTTSEEVQTKTGVNMSNANFVKLTLDSFDQSTGKAIYKIQLKNKANFQLLSQLNYAETTQILSIQIKD